MNRLGFDTGSVRAQRLRALAPRVLLLLTLAILCVNGLRTILGGPAERVVEVQAVAQQSGETGISTFAESFARAYLTWDADDLDAREQALAPFLGDNDPDGGLEPADGTSQDVSWTGVVAAQRIGARTLVTVSAQTSGGRRHLSVPVARDRQGLLRIVGYPALVGAPAVDVEHSLEGAREDEVRDESLRTVAKRALANYLAHAQGNLLADLTPTATVALPDAQLTLGRVEAITWVVPERRIAVQAQATDPAGSELTLRYELDVYLSDRWYVHSIHVNPTS